MSEAPRMTNDTKCEGRLAERVLAKGVAISALAVVLLEIEKNMHIEFSEEQRKAIDKSFTDAMDQAMTMFVMVSRMPCEGMQS